MTATSYINTSRAIYLVNDEIFDERYSIISIGGTREAAPKAKSRCAVLFQPLISGIHAASIRPKQTKPANTEKSIGSSSVGANHFVQNRKSIGRVIV